MRAAARLAAELGRTAAALLVTTDDESMQRRAVGQLLDLFQGQITIVAISGRGKPAAVASRVLKQCWPSEKGGARDSRR